jgi:hypothetical protein
MSRVVFSDGRSSLVLEDSATSDSVAEAKAAKLVERDKVDVVLGGIYRHGRQSSALPSKGWSSFTATRRSTRARNATR